MIITSHVIAAGEFRVHALQKTSAEVVLCNSTGEVLYQKNENERVSIASLTKILTAITAIENYDLSREITITEDMVGVEGSSIYLKVGEVLSLKELLYGLMLRSGNDAATAIAVGCAGSIEDFVDLMNKTAIKSGAFSSHFVNPHGLEEKDHYSTALDIARITAYALKNKDFAEIVSTKRVKLRNTSGGEERILINKNKMLYRYDGADGVKTGYTKTSGRCLISSATKNGVQLICVVINRPDTYERTIELFDRYFEKYDLLGA